MVLSLQAGAQNNTEDLIGGIEDIGCPEINGFDDV